MSLLDGAPVQKFDLAKLSDEGHLALAYCQALEKGPKSPEALRYFVGKAKMHEAEKTPDGKRIPGMTERDFNTAKDKGIQELLALGLIEAKRDGHREWQVTVIHYEKMTKVTGIVLGEGN